MGQTVKEVVIHLIGQPTALHNKLMTFGLFQGTTAQLIRDDKINKLLILGLGQKRIVLRKEELKGIELKESNA